MSRNPPSQNQLVQVFNLNANLPGSLLLPAVQGTMDVSQQWPLKQPVRAFDYTAVVGTNSVVISKPPNGFHELIIMAGYTMNTPAAGKASVLFLTDSSQSGPTANISVSRVGMVVLSQVPLIQSTYWQDAFAGGFAQTVGNPLYVPFPFTLTHSLVGAAGGELCTLRTLSMRLPASQPFQSLLGLF